MDNIELVSNLANFASFFVEEGRWYRIIYCDDENDFFNCTDEDGLEYQVNYDEVDLATDKFYKSVEMNPEDYRDLQAISG